LKAILNGIKMICLLPALETMNFLEKMTKEKNKKQTSLRKKNNRKKTRKRKIIKKKSQKLEQFTYY
jgi:hypothetical protein